MGVPRFFAWLYKNYPECLVALKNAENFKTRGISVDSYALDVNAIIHPICQKMYNYGNNNNNKKNIYIPTEKEVFAEICNVIENLRKLVNPSKQFILAIDGSAGLSKQTQQRQRRFKSALDRKNNGDTNTFDSNKITTGSQFMYNLSRYIHVYISRQLKREWKHLDVIFSNEKVVGEGEHKIIRYINKDKNMIYCIHSPDADLIMLTVGLDNPNIYIVRENIYTSIDCTYFVVNAGKFKQTLLQLLKWTSFTRECIEEYVIYDFIVLCFFLGNDFLPHVPSLEISNEGLELILETYPRIATEYGHIVYRNKSRDLSLNTNMLYHLFYSIAGKENELLNVKSRESIKFPDILLLESRIKKINTKNSLTTIDFKTYHQKYYSQRLGGIKEEDVCNEYFKGLLFVLRYYIDEIPDWHWFYPYHYAPFFNDMYAYVKNFNGEMKFEKHYPLSPFEQLLAVLPPSSCDILPQPFRYLFTDEKSPIIDFYPLKFDIDLQGKRQEWEGRPLLPFINVDRLKSAYQKVEGITSEEAKINANGKNTRYFLDGDVVKTIFFN